MEGELMVRKNKDDEAAYQKEYHKNWYAKNRIERKKQIHDRRSKLFAWYKEYKKTLSCSICGFSHPAAIDFHHRDPSKKNFNLSKAMRSGVSIKTFLREVEQCDILCANCHRVLHYSEIG